MLVINCCHAQSETTNPCVLRAVFLQMCCKKLILIFYRVRTAFYRNIYMSGSRLTSRPNSRITNLSRFHSCRFHSHPQRSSFHLTGYVYCDDDDQRNVNKFSGVLSNGTYDRNTTPPRPTGRRSNEKGIAKLNDHEKQHAARTFVAHQNRFWTFGKTAEDVTPYRIIATSVVYSYLHSSTNRKHFHAFVYVV